MNEHGEKIEEVTSIFSFIASISLVVFLLVVIWSAFVEHGHYSNVCGWFEDDIGVAELMLWTIKFKYSRLAVPFPSLRCGDDVKPIAKRIFDDERKKKKNINCF